MHWRIFANVCNENQTVTKSSRVYIATTIFGLVLLLVYQSFSIGYYPLPDSWMWWGDETWRMLSSRDLILTGHPVITQALGSTLSSSVGLVGSSSWITELLYGIPAALAGKGADIILIGRWISFIVSMTCCGLLYLILYGTGVSMTRSLFAVVLFCTAGPFLLGSHSARPDMMTAFGILLFILTAVRALKSNLTDGSKHKALFWLGLVWAGGPLFYLHVAPLTSIAFIFVVFRFKAWRMGIDLLFLLSGILLGVALWVLPFIILSGTLSFSGAPGRPDQYHYVLNSLPIFHLFSLQTQLSNTVGRIKQWWDYSSLLLLLVTATIVVSPARTRRVAAKERPLLWIAGCIVLGMLLFQGHDVSYLVHILPVLVISAIVLWVEPDPSVREDGAVAFLRRPNEIYSVIFIMFAFFTLHRQSRGSEIALKTKEQAVDSLLKLARSASRHPTILTDMGEASFVLQDTSIKMMTWHFLGFPATLSPLTPVVIDSILIANHVEFVLANNRWPQIMNYTRNRLPIISISSGFMHEGVRETSQDPPDTIFLFRASSR